MGWFLKLDKFIEEIGDDDSKLNGKVTKGGALIGGIAGALVGLKFGSLGSAVIGSIIGAFIGFNAPLILTGLYFGGFLLLLLICLVAVGVVIGFLFSVKV